MDVQPVAYHHNHIAKPDKKSQKKIMIAALITASYMLVEIIGGLWVNSIALVADGVHMMTDAMALGIACWGFHMLNICEILFHFGKQCVLRPTLKNLGNKNAIRL
mgnify:CR=1 FL=1